MEMKELDKAMVELARATRYQGDLVVSVQHPILTSGDWERKFREKTFRKFDHCHGERELEAVSENEKEFLPSTTTGRCDLTWGSSLRGDVSYPHEVYKMLNPREQEDTKRIPHFTIF